MISAKKFWQEWRGFFIFMLLMFLFRSAVADWYEVPTGSMKPTIIEGDRIFVNKLAYKLRVPFTLIPIASWDAPKHNDIVVFDSPVEAQRLIKRVVGLPGDKIEIINNQLYVNNVVAQYHTADQTPVLKYWEDSNDKPELLNETFDGKEHRITILPRRDSPARNFGPYVVPAQHYFMMGDNRDNSADSRYIGPVDQKYILGRANSVILSFSHSERYLQALQ
jgi:signal peptidase I